MSAKKVLEAFKNAGKPMKPGDIAQVLGMDSKEVSKYIKELKENGELISPKRCFYSPK
ncbi:MAG: transcriptional regulator [Candidatus Delongbacteria bacterium]|nr:transcriptional regulator [Candidatus Delongbacteria bacterium]